MQNNIVHLIVSKITMGANYGKPFTTNPVADKYEITADSCIVSLSDIKALRDNDVWKNNSCHNACASYGMNGICAMKPIAFNFAISGTLVGSMRFTVLEITGITDWHRHRKSYDDSCVDYTVGKYLELYSPVFAECKCIINPTQYELFVELQKYVANSARLMVVYDRWVSEATRLQRANEENAKRGLQSNP